MTTAHEGWARRLAEHGRVFAVEGGEVRGGMTATVPGAQP